jgi:hypothetical protein
MSLPGFLSHPTRHLFFTGKGGVGKTTVAAALALGLVQRGKSVHLSTTDPAAHLTEEVAVFHAFSRIVSEGRSAFVVRDTAPTGHAMHPDGCHRRLPPADDPRVRRPWRHPRGHALDAPGCSTRACWLPAHTTLCWLPAWRVSKSRWPA